MANFTLLQTENFPVSVRGMRMVLIDGAHLPTLSSLLAHVALSLEFPADADQTLEEVDALLNDLHWINEKEICFCFKNFEQLLSKEKSSAKLLEFLNLLDATAEDWKWLDDDDDTPPKKIHAYVLKSPKAIQVFEEEGIGFETLKTNL